jgi:aspartokinase-like uncharacterized kinase
MMADSERPLSVVAVKVGGSLYNLPDLGLRLRQWLTMLAMPQAVFVPGGGTTADLVRGWDQCHSLGEEKSHWLALAALSLNARFLAAVFTKAKVVEGLAGCISAWRNEQVPVLDPFTLLCADEGRDGCLPHSWSVTSDSVAARMTSILGARRLILLKSISIPPGMTWIEAGRAGFVDPCFGEVLDATVVAEAVNFRSWPE